MKTKITTFVFLAFIAILGWNAFLIKRDDSLYKLHTTEYSPKEQYCKYQAGWHPDCNVE